MMSVSKAIKYNPIVNGIDTDKVVDLVTKVTEDEYFGKFQFRAHNEWIHGSRNRTLVQGFFAGGEENTSRNEEFSVDADQPDFLAGKNTAPNPIEHYLHALTSCLTTTLAYHASVQGINIDEIRIAAEGDINVRGFFGVSNKINKGYECIRVEMKVRSTADIETLKTLAMYSPVYEMASKGTPIEFNLTKV